MEPPDSSSTPPPQPEQWQARAALLRIVTDARRQRHLYELGELDEKPNLALLTHEERDALCDLIAKHERELHMPPGRGHAAQVV